MSEELENTTESTPEAQEQPEVQSNDETTSVASEAPLSPFTEEFKIDSFRIWDSGKVVLTVEETFYKHGQFIGKRQAEVEVIDGNPEHMGIILNYMELLKNYYKSLTA